MPEIDTDFSAKEPSLGYFYQIKYALWLFISNKDLDEASLRIESLDDIDITNVDITNLYQTKLHIKNKANLTDASTDFWKTMRIWSEHIQSNIVDVEKSIFNLITTEQVPDTSILYKLKEGSLIPEEIEEVIKKLDSISISSISKTNEKGYQAYNSLSSDIKKKLIKNIRILDNSLETTELENRIRKELQIFIYPDYLDDFCDFLSGWWLRCSIEILTNSREFITYQELQTQINNLRDKYSADNLPNHFPEQLDISDKEVNDLKDKNFIRQLDLIQIKLSSKTTKRAISDFRRAYEQRSRWLRLQLLNPSEEEEFDKRLLDYWKNIFEIMCDEADENEADIEELKKLGKQFYLEQFAKNTPQIKIRDKFNEDYLTRGSLHILSDHKKIGWHPKFNDEL